MPDRAAGWCLLAVGCWWAERSSQDNVTWLSAHPALLVGWSVSVCPAEGTGTLAGSCISWIQIACLHTERTLVCNWTTRRLLVQLQTGDDRAAQLRWHPAVTFCNNMRQLAKTTAVACSVTFVHISAGSLQVVKLWVGIVRLPCFVGILLVTGDTLHQTQGMHTGRALICIWVGSLQVVELQAGDN